MNSNNKYIKLSLEDLILISVLSVKSKSEDCTFERLVKECFVLFPKKFAFSRYPNWPDPLKMDRPLRKLKERGLLTGSRTDNFQLSLFGKKLSSRLARQLKLHELDTLLHRPNQGRKEKRIFERIKESPLFQNFLIKGPDFESSKTEIKSLFLCTVETPNRIVKIGRAHV